MRSQYRDTIELPAHLPPHLSIYQANIIPNCAPLYVLTGENPLVSVFQSCVPFTIHSSSQVCHHFHICSQVADFVMFLNPHPLDHPIY